MLMTDVEIGDAFVRFLGSRPGGTARFVDLVGPWRKADILRYSLLHGLVEVMPRDSRLWLGVADAPSVDFAALLADCDEHTSVRVGPAGRATLNEEYSEARGNPEKAMAKNRRIAAFKSGH